MLFHPSNPAIAGPQRHRRTALRHPCGSGTAGPAEPPSTGFQPRPPWARRVAWGLGLLLWGALGVFSSQPVQAGTTCQESPLSVDQVQSGMALANATARKLDASGAEVVVLARAGQDLSRYGVQWSHLAFALREPRPVAAEVLPSEPVGSAVPALPTRAAVLAELTGASDSANGAAKAAVDAASTSASDAGSELSAGASPVAATAWSAAAAASANPSSQAAQAPQAPLSPWVWRVVHKLNACGTAEGQLYRQGLGEFFLDRPHRYEAAFVVPAPKVQARLLELLRQPERLPLWHEPRYNMLAYPWALTYQQSNQWLMETLAGALAPQAADRRRAQAWLQFMGYQPTVLHIDALTRLGARIGMPHIAFDDHPNSERFADRIATVTADSVFAWLTSTGLAGRVRRVP